MGQCIVCESKSFPIKNIDDEIYGKYTVHKCESCRLEFCCPMPSDSDLNLFYSDYKDIRAEEHVIMANAKKNKEVIFGLGLDESSKILDFGSGKNAFVRYANKNGYNYLSYDKYTSDNDTSVLRKQWFDAIVSWGCIEHVIDPKQYLFELNSYLRMGDSDFNDC